MTISTELERISRQEEKLRRQHHKEPVQWKTALEAKVPPKIYDNLKSVFAKAFHVIFEKGTDLIEKTYRKEEIEKDFKVRDYAVNLEMNSRDLALLEANAHLSNLVSLAVSTVEGVGLGALGIGLPDIVLFVSMILRGCYETALRYGFQYDTDEEKWFILLLLEGAMVRGEDWDKCNQMIDEQIRQPVTPAKELLDEQMKKTADAFAMDMLLTKFIQGLPFVGMVGGAANPYYYRKILNFVRLKYRKRYLLQK
ncbi:MAG: EcsC family protein [Oscillospiraceae bacterium]|nr:EcsC family protein [Oscillospiraceae bacterium]MBQ6403987.1 EcsC family protein [Oscillospiraceae bacterium]